LVKIPKSKKLKKKLALCVLESDALSLFRFK